MYSLLNGNAEYAVKSVSLRFFFWNLEAGNDRERLRLPQKLDSINKRTNFRLVMSKEHKIPSTKFAKSKRFCDTAFSWNSVLSFREIIKLCMQTSTVRMSKVFSYLLSTLVHQLGFVWNFSHNQEEFAIYLKLFRMLIQLPLLGYACDYYPNETPCCVLIRSWSPVMVQNPWNVLSCSAKITLYV